MENQNEQTNTETKATAVGGKREPSFAAAIFGAAKEPAAEKGNKSPEEGAGAQPESAEIDLLAGADDSTTLARGAGDGEGESETVDVWQFNGVDYTADQVEEALRERESYQRHNQSVQPLAEAIQRAEDDTARFKEMALYGNARVYGNAQVYCHAHHITIGPIGSECGVVTAFRQSDNSIIISRGCFSGTIEEFAEAVRNRHGGTHYADEYEIVIKLIETRLMEVD
ncbi:hypothetical protein R5D33_003271 [Salmonella enterica]|uniref:Uncharacterized protein n=1 Tax=Salmonella enterica subsp. VII serovar 40:z4,z24:[z39] TaxID=1967625 RepID=A0A731XV20_SALEE|nr:hypothetical protein [Salmonella enterica]EDO5297791.1 hypothetical protein [Salmonella enterica subsp. houtenae serovar 40:z4,z24:-]QUZ21679.1 hypothetical protein JYN32_11265 [Salmonella enterica subsp. VII str. CFSAN000554]HAE4734144.1 hypothetical protein [Salmonella enterica subsp. VII serovar 40:z4,z24:[z39]]HCA3677319.1 hypothetical protein [Salmonella enterica subsp. houtenae serovar Houten]